MTQCTYILFKKSLSWTFFCLFVKDTTKNEDFNSTDWEWKCLGNEIIQENVDLNIFWLVIITNILKGVFTSLYYVIFYVGTTISKRGAGAKNH